MSEFILPYDVYKPYNSDCSYFIKIEDDNVNVYDVNTILEILNDKEYLYIQIALYNKIYGWEPVDEVKFGYVDGEYISMNEAFKKLMKEAEKYFSRDTRSYKVNIGFEGGMLGEILGEDNGVYYIDYHKGYLRIGTLCNSGMIPDAEYKYDSCFTLDENIQSAVERFIEER